MFKGAQQLTSAFNQQRTVGAGEFYEYFGLVPFSICSAGLTPGGDAIAQPESAVREQCLQILVDLFCGVNSILNWHAFPVGGCNGWRELFSSVLESISDFNPPRQFADETAFRGGCYGLPFF